MSEANAFFLYLYAAKIKIRPDLFGLMGMYYQDMKEVG